MSYCQYLLYQGTLNSGHVGLSCRSESVPLLRNACPLLCRKDIDCSSYFHGLPNLRVCVVWGLGFRVF